MNHLQEHMQNPVMQAGALGVGYGLGLVALTTVYNHRELTHQSLTTKPLLQVVARTMMAAEGIIPRHWAAVHTIHHHYPDANVVPIIETADLLTYLDDHPDASHPPIAPSFSNLDPAAKLTPNDIKRIGSLAREPIQDHYTAPKEYCWLDMARLLDSDTQRYMYEPREYSLRQRRKYERLLVRGGNKPHPDSLQSLSPKLRDPHSPALHPKGGWGILRGDNVILYKGAAKYFAKLEQTGEDIGAQEKESRYDNTKPFLIGRYALSALAFTALGIRRNKRPSELIYRAGLGIAAMAIADAELIVGGNITNAAGHEPNQNFFLSLLSKATRGAAPVCKPNGGYASNSRIGSRITFDEVGGQEDHHRDPGLVAYTTKRGLAKLLARPFGTIVEQLASRRLLLTPGSQFGGAPPAEQMTTSEATTDQQKRRPDEESAAVAALKELRIRQPKS